MNETTLKTYGDCFITMNPIFITFTYLEAFLFMVFGIQAICKYLPIFTSQSIGILMAFFMGYLVQASTFLRIYKFFGDQQITKEGNQSYDTYIRGISIVQWLIYMLFFIIIFKIEALYQKFKGLSEKRIKLTQIKLKIFVLVYLIIMVAFHYLAFQFGDLTVDQKHLFKLIYGLAIFAVFFFLFLFVKFMYNLFKFLNAIQYETMTQENLNSNNFQKSMIIKKIFICIWFIIYLQDIVFITFLRPGGSIIFIEQNIFEYANSNDSFKSALRKYFQINQNLSLFIIGLFVIKLYSHFGKKYYDILEEQTHEELLSYLQANNINIEEFNQKNFQQKDQLRNIVVNQKKSYFSGTYDKKIVQQNIKQSKFNIKSSMRKSVFQSNSNISSDEMYKDTLDDDDTLTNQRLYEIDFYNQRQGFGQAKRLRGLGETEEKHVENEVSVTQNIQIQDQKDEEQTSLAISRQSLLSKHKIGSSVHKKESSVSSKFALKIVGKFGK